MSCISIESSSWKAIIRWATPCDGKVECIDGRDEQGCESPIWLLLAVLLVTIFALLCSLFGFFYIYIRRKVEEISRNTNSTSQQPLQSISCKQQKHIYIAMLLDQEDTEGLKILMEKEIESHGSEGKGLCCYKVKVATNLKHINCELIHSLDIVLFRLNEDI